MRTPQPSERVHGNRVAYVCAKKARLARTGCGRVARVGWLHRTSKAFALEILTKIRRRCCRPSQHAQQPEGIFASRTPRHLPCIPQVVAAVTARRPNADPTWGRSPRFGSEKCNDGSGAHFVKTPAVARPYRGCTPYTLKQCRLQSLRGCTEQSRIPCARNWAANVRSRAWLAVTGCEHVARGGWLHHTYTLAGACASEISTKIRRRCRCPSQHAQQPDGIYAKRARHAAAPPVPDTSGRGRHYTGSGK